MKALSPVRGCYEAVCCLSERSLAIARGRGKGPAAEEPLSLLDDMNHCYSRLRELVPGVPRGTQLSQVEILQRVIDYILDLQVVLAEPAPGPPDGPHLPIQVCGACAGAGAGLSSRAGMLPGPLKLPNAVHNFSLFPFSQTAELAPELVISNDKRSFCH